MKIDCSVPERPQSRGPWGAKDEAQLRWIVTAPITKNFSNHPLPQYNPFLLSTESFNR